MSKDRRGLQKRIAVLFDGVWIPKKKRQQPSPEVNTPVEQPQQQEIQTEEHPESGDIVYGT